VSGGPTNPFAPAIPGIMWQAPQPFAAMSSAPCVGDPTANGATLSCAMAAELTKARSKAGIARNVSPVITSQELKRSRL
jgi:hypothetical protein